MRLSLREGEVVSDEKRPDRRLPRRLRVALSRDFQAAFAAERGRPSRFMVLWFNRKPEDGTALRLGVVASKRSFRRAVDRARAKRLLREAFRLHRFQFRGAGDMILLARPPIRLAGCAEVEKDLLALARRAGLMRGEGQ